MNPTLSLLQRVKDKALAAIQGASNLYIEKVAKPLAIGVPQVQQTIQNISSPGVESVGRTIANFGENTIPQQTQAGYQAQDQLFKKAPLKLLTIPRAANNLLSDVIGGVLSDVGRTVERVATPTGRESLAQGVKDIPTQVKNKDFSALIDNPALVALMAAPDLSDIGKQTGKVLLKKGIKETGEKVVEQTVKQEAKTVAKEVVKEIPLAKIAKATAGEVKDVNILEKAVLPRVQRLEKSLPAELFKPLKESIIDPYLGSVGESVDWARTARTQVQSLGIAPGSKMSKLVEQFGTGVKTYEQVVKEVGKMAADKIVAADSFFRKFYSETRDLINTKRLAKGLAEIPEKENYYRSMKQFSGGIKGVVDSLTSGGKSGEFSSTLFKKQGAKESFDAVSGVVDYIEHAKAAGFSDLIVPDLQKYTETLRAAGADEKVVKYLDDFAETISGVKEVGGVGKTIENVTAPFRKAKVIGNPGTILAQTFNFAQGVGRDPVSFFKGLGNTQARLAAKQSPYLKALTERIPLSLTKGAGKKAVQAGGALLQEANGFTAKTLWKSFYQRAISDGKNAKQAVQFAEDMIPQIMGDRRLGMLPGIAETPIGRVLSAFTLENQAGINLLVKDIGEKKAGAVIGTLVAWHLANKGVEKVGQGYTPFFDPVEAILDASEQWNGSERKEANKVKAVGRIVGEMFKLTPSLQSSIFTIYKGGEALGALPEARDVFGSEDPTWQNVGSLYNPFENITRNITGNKLVDVPFNLASSVVPYVNTLARGTQAKVSLDRGATETRNGQIMYETPKDPFNKARSLIFGQSSTPQAQEYFDNDFNRPLSDKQTEIFKASGEGKSSYLEATQEKIRAKNKIQSYTAKEAGGLAKLFGGDKVPELDAIKTEYFDGMDAGTAKNATDKRKIFNGVLKVMSDDTLPEEYKAKVIEASGAKPDEIQYYQIASQLEEDRITSTIEYAQNASHDELVQNLLLNKREIAGKSITSSKTIDYLYDAGYIGKEDKKLLTAMKWDPVYSKFYLDRDYKGGGTTDSQRKAYINKLNSIFKVGGTTTKKSSLKKLNIPTGGISSKVPKTSSNLTLTPKKTGTNWFAA